MFYNFGDFEFIPSIVNTLSYFNDDLPKTKTKKQTNLYGSKNTVRQKKLLRKNNYKIR